MKNIAESQIIEVRIGCRRGVLCELYGASLAEARDMLSIRGYSFLLNLAIQKIQADDALGVSLQLAGFGIYVSVVYSPEQVAALVASELAMGEAMMAAAKIAA